ncbi:MAG: DUF4168 domain-containing protein [Sphingomonadales bacterium]|nr:MAG: DUF4168 domain-containing protein [Sphingomonadales bacterium]
MKLSHTLTLSAALLAAPAAFAQDAAQTAPATAAPATTAAPAATPAPAQAGTVTDAEVDQYVTGALAVNDLQADTTLSAADKGAKMSAAVTATGLTAERFNAITQAMQADPALNKRIQDAGAAKKAASPAAAPAATPAPSAPATTPGN